MNALLMAVLMLFSGSGKMQEVSSCKQITEIDIDQKNGDLEKKQKSASQFKTSKAEKQMFPGFVFMDPAEIMNTKEGLLSLPSIVYRHSISEIGVDENMSLVTAAPDSTKLTEWHECFYMKQLEVTNAEYRLFVNWTRDSIARSILSEKFPEKFLLTEMNLDFPGLRRLNWKAKLEYFKWYNELHQLYLPETERYYRRREIDVRKLEYVYLDKNEKISNNVYPDTNCWFREAKLMSLFPNGSMVSTVLSGWGNMYFWHPAFDNYPVVGLTTSQISAFLHWKGKQYNQFFSGKLKKGKQIKLFMPSDFEMELAACYELLRSGRSLSHRVKNYNFDLFVSGISVLGDSIADTLYEKMKSSVHQLITIHPHFHYLFEQQSLPSPNGWGKLIAGNFVTIPDNREKIYSLSGNVSEWTNTSFTGTRKWFFEQMEAEVRTQIHLIPFLSTPFHPQFTEGQQLIWGANFMDSRNREEVLPLNQTPYTYSDSERGYATVGFRYIIRVEDQK